MLVEAAINPALATRGRFTLEPASPSFWKECSNRRFVSLLINAGAQYLLKRRNRSQNLGVL
jgi:hypothetical protein